MGIVVIGATLVDIKGYPYDQYNPTGRNTGRIIQVHGGVCRNIAEDIANVELRPVFVSLVDHSGLGEDCIRKLEKHKVNVDYIRKTEDGLGTWMAIFDNSGDVAGSISKRPDLREIGRILEEQGDEIFENADSVCVEVDINVEILKQVLRLAEKYGKEVYAVISNMSLAVERRDLIQRTACFVCNQQEAGMFFSRDFEKLSPEELAPVLRRSSDKARIPRMVVTMGGRGSVYADNLTGEWGIVPSINVDVIDTTGAGDAFFAGVVIGLTYGKDLRQACMIGTRIAGSVIATRENVCPRFHPEEFGIEISAGDEKDRKETAHD